MRVLNADLNAAQVKMLESRGFKEEFDVIDEQYWFVNECAQVDSNEEDKLYEELDSLEQAKCRWCGKVANEGQAYCSLSCLVCYDDA